MKDLRIIYFLVGRIVLTYLLGDFTPPSNSSGLIWLFLIFSFFCVSSGWVYYFAFKVLGNKVFTGVSLTVFAFFMDVFFSMKFFDGAKEFLPHFLYAISGVILFWIVYFAAKPK